MGPVRQNQSRELLGLFICVCIALCTIVAHSIAQNRPVNFPSYPPDNHHFSTDVYMRERGERSTEPQPYVTCSENFVNFERVVFEISEPTDTHTDTLIAMHSQYLAPIQAAK